MLEAKWLNKSATERKRHAVMDTGCVGGRAFLSSRTLEHVCSGPGSISSSYEVKKRREDLATETGWKIFILISMKWVVLVGADRCWSVSWKLYSLSFSYGFIFQVGVQMHKSRLTMFMKFNMGCVFTGQQSSTLKPITTFAGLHFGTFSNFDSVGSNASVWF